MSATSDSAVLRSSKPWSVRHVLALGILAAVVGGAGLWVAAQEPARQRVVLSDGSVLTVDGYTYGKEHRWDERPWWGRLLPTPRGALSPVKIWQTPDDTLAMWLRIPARQGGLP